MGWQWVDDDEPRGPPPLPRRRVQTIEATGKEWKLMILLGYVLLIPSCSMSCLGAAATSGRPNEPMDGMLETFLIGTAIGFGLLLVGKIGKWWYHE